MNRFAVRHAGIFIVAAAAAAWSTLHAAMMLGDHASFRTGRFDLGNMTQAVWSTAQGRPLETTFAHGEQMSRLASHVDPVLVAFAPGTFLFPTPEFLIVCQAALLSLGAFAVHRLARLKLGSEGPAVLLALAYLVYPWVAWQAVNEFHPVSLAIPLLLFAVLFLEEGRTIPFAVVAAIALACGELIGLAVGALGLWDAVAHRRPRRGLTVAALGFGYTALALGVIIPAVSGEHSPFYERFESVGGSPGGLLQTALTDPLVLIRAATTVDDLIYVAWLVVPLAGVALLAPGALLFGAPQLALNLLSDDDRTVAAEAQYVSAVLPALVAATVFGIARLPPRRHLIGAGVVLSTTLIAFAAVAPWPNLRARITSPTAPEQPGRAFRADARSEAIALVPAQDPVAATNRLAAHLSERRYVYSVPVLRRARWIAVDLEEPWFPHTPGHVGGLDPARMTRFIESLDRDPRWRLVFERASVRVYHRVE
jgi:uncharacterized membrane protein